ALYLIFLSIKHLYDKATLNEHDVKKKESKSGFWMTVLKVEIADLAFAVDSILAAVALAVTLPATGLFEIGSLDGAQFIVIFAGVYLLNLYENGLVLKWLPLLSLDGLVFN